MTTRKLHSKSKVVAHSLPHRTRLRLPRGHRDAATIAKVHKTISNTKGVHSVEINERTGSVLIHHDEDPEVLAKVGDALEDVAGELFEAILEAGRSRNSRFEHHCASDQGKAFHMQTIVLRWQQITL